MTSLRGVDASTDGSAELGKGVPTSVGATRHAGRAAIASRRAISLVARREIRTRLRSRAFLAGVGVTVLLIVVVFAIGAAVGGDEPTRIGIVEPGADAAIAALEQRAELEDRDLEITRFDAIDSAERAVLDGSVDGAVDGDRLIVERDDPDLLGFVSPAWQQAGLLDCMSAAGLDDAEIADALAGAVPLDVRELEPDDDREDRDAIAFITVVLLFISVQIAGAYILMGILEEKTTKVVEVILSSIRARDLLAGKVLGIGVVGLVQMAVLVGVVLGAAVIAGSDVLPSITIEIVVAGLIWFLVGYLFYGCLFATGAAIVSRQEDAQSTLAPVSVLAMGSYFVSIFVTQSETTVGRVLSLLPPIAPFSMPGRMAIGDVAAWEVAVAFASAIVAVTAVLRLAGRIYVRSVLHTDRTFSWREAWRLED